MESFLPSAPLPGTQVFSQSWGEVPNWWPSTCISLSGPTAPFQEIWVRLKVHARHERNEGHRINHGGFRC